MNFVIKSKYSFINLFILGICPLHYNKNKKKFVSNCATALYTYFLVVIICMLILFAFDALHSFESILDSIYHIIEYLHSATISIFYVLIIFSCTNNRQTQANFLNAVLKFDNHFRNELKQNFPDGIDQKEILFKLVFAVIFLCCNIFLEMWVPDYGFSWYSSVKVIAVIFMEYTTIFACFHFQYCARLLTSRFSITIQQLRNCDCDQWFNGKNETLNILDDLLELKHKYGLAFGLLILKCRFLDMLELIVTSYIYILNAIFQNNYTNLVTILFTCAYIIPPVTKTLLTAIELEKLGTQVSCR